MAYAPKVTLRASAEGASGVTLLAAGGAGVKYRVYEVIITADTAGEITLSDGIGSIQHISAGGQIIFDLWPEGDKQTTANTAITITNSAGGNVGGEIKYIKDA